MRHDTDRWRPVGVTLGCVLLFGLLAFSVGLPTTAATESTENVSVYRASNASLESAADARAAIGDGTADPAEDVAVGDTLVVAITSARLTDAMNATDGSPTARFFAALDGEAEFRVVQTNPTPQKNRKIAVFGPANVTVHRDAGTAYVLVETGDLTFQYRRIQERARIYDGDRFAVQFGYDLPDTWSRATVPSSSIVEFHPRSQLPTAQPGTSPPTQTPPTQTPTQTPTLTPTAIPTEQPSPGFGIVSGALSLLTAALLAGSHEG